MNQADFDPARLQHLSDRGSAAERIRRYNVLYLTPPTDPASGAAIGDGERGALLWFERDRMHLALNRTDLWRDGAAGIFRNWAREEEESSTTLRHGGHVELNFLLPVFDPNYLKDCRLEVELDKGAVSGRIESVFGTLQLQLFASETTGLLRLKLEFIPREDTRFRLDVSHYGSRSYAHWYSRVANTPETGLESTTSEMRDGVLSVAHEVSDGFFALGAGAIVPEAAFFLNGDGGGGLKQRHRVEAESPVCRAGKRCTLEIAFFLSGPEFPDAQAAHAGAARELRRRGKGMSFEEDLEGNRKFYETFWKKSLLSSGDDYFDALYALHLFYSNASQRGRYPARFMQGLWGFEHDFQPWNFYFHWNQQLGYFALAPAGHLELNKSYLNWRLSGLEKARRAAAVLFNAPGGFVSDVTDRRNYSSGAERNNRTVMAQIGCALYEQFRYSGDRGELRERVLPYLYAAAEFLFFFFHRGSDGRYHPSGGSAYEGWILLDDCCTELNCARALARVLAAAEDELGISSELRRTCETIAANLAELPLLNDLDSFSDADSPECCAVGVGKKHPWCGASRLAAGRLPETGKVVASIMGRKPSPEPGGEETRGAFPVSDPLETALEELHRGVAECSPALECAGYDGIFPFAELSAVFPSGNWDLSCRDEALFGAAVNTALIGAAPGGWIAWDPTSIHLARLGEGEILFEYLKKFISRHQRFHNGHFVDSLMARETLSPLCRNRVADLESGDDSKRRNFRAWEFRHMGSEGLGVVAAALTEAMMQSCNGIIRIFPALPAGDEGGETPERAFTLYAEGGHRISALWRGTEWTAALLITLGWETHARIAADVFRGKWLRIVSSGGAVRRIKPEKAASAAEAYFELSGKCGENFFCAAEEEFEAARAAFDACPAAPGVRTTVRFCGLAQLGEEKLF